MQRRYMKGWWPGMCLLALLQIGCAADRAADRSRMPPSQASDWVESKLYFGLGPADQPAQGISEAAWRQFLDHEVSPRFPEGLSVLDAYGQWQPAQGTLERLRSKVLLIDYPDSADNRRKVEAIRIAWKQRTGDRSVLRVTQPAEISF
jgi:hypothetical protein